MNVLMVLEVRVPIVEEAKIQIRIGKMRRTPVELGFNWKKLKKNTSFLKVCIS